MKKFNSKLKALEWSQHFFHYKFMGICPSAQGQVTHILPNFEPIRDNEEDPFKNEGARVVTTLFIDFSESQGQLTPKSVMESCPKSNLSELLWLVLLPARMKFHPKMEKVNLLSNTY